MEKTQQEVDRIEPINILVAGKTGSGKSTLINAVFREKLAETGVGQPITQHVEKITKEGVPLTLYDTKGLELNPEAQHEVLLALSDLIKSQKEKGPHEAIDIVYYCINSTMARIEPFEIELIEAMAEHVPVLLILTQAIGEKNSDFEKYLNELDMPVQSIIPLLAKTYLIRGEQRIPAYGLQELIDTTLEVVPTEVHKAFINAQQIDLNIKVEHARRWANKYVASAFGVGFSPIPISDATLLVPMQITMLAHITSIFGLSLDKSQIVSIIAGIGGTGGATYFGKILVSSAFKLIPGIGTVAGGMISGTTASVLTVALAFSYIEVLRQIAIAEIIGRDMKIKEIQQIMNKNLSEQLDVVYENLPKDIKEKYLPEWLSTFLNQ
ncbi:50S ribosome-binding GTPase [Facklamia tabacinasalis]|uniref:50S ribosome-binding GTPase n=2 Tax=Ruoffia tabacinasalis TaxID=87458 RepID=A0ABS0LI13_9LACT|nr:GTPase [Ruoffia tabacinasalis]MBG9977697.1 50S ribosome-binding GTPase [Ruoffia tabacinasalis]